MSSRAVISRSSIVLIIVALLGLPLVNVEAEPVQDPFRPELCNIPITLNGNWSGNQTAEAPLPTVAATEEAALNPAFCLWLAGLNGIQANSGKGDPDGTGLALISFNTKTNNLCIDTIVQDIKVPATGTYLFKPANAFGPKFAFAYSPPIANGRGTGCLLFRGNRGPRTDAVIADIQQRPHWFIDIANREYPNGALSGQLFGADELTGKATQGDPDGLGVFSIQFNLPKNEMCYQTWVDKVDLPITEMGLYQNDPSGKGILILPLQLPNEKGFGNYCEDVNFTKLREIALAMSSPSGLQARLFNAKFPDGPALTGRNLRTWTDYRGLDPEAK
jgi:hypothetical protein